MTREIRHLALIVTLVFAALTTAPAQSQQPPSSTPQPDQQSGTPVPRKAKHVYTNDDIASSPDAGKPADNNHKPDDSAVSLPADPKISADQVRELVRKQKARVADAEAARDKIQRLLDRAPKSDCRNLYDPSDPRRDVCTDFAKVPDRLKQAQARVDKEKSALASLQQVARKMGYGSAVYDPN